MKKTTLGAVAALALAACSPESPAPLAPSALSEPPLAAAANENEPIPDQYIVVFREDVQDAPGLANRLARQHGASMRYTYGAAIKGFAANMSAQAAAALERNPNVAYVEQDREVS